MTINDKEMNAYINKCVRNNMLQIFTIDNRENIFDLQRHVCSKIEEIPGDSLKKKIENSIFVILYLCELWYIHLQKSNYQQKYFLGIQIEKEWINNGVGEPPVVVLNSKNSDMVRFFPDFIFIKDVNKIDGIIINVLSEFTELAHYDLKENTDGTLRIEFSIDEPTGGQT